MIFNSFEVERGRKNVSLAGVWFFLSTFSTFHARYLILCILIFEKEEKRLERKRKIVVIGIKEMEKGTKSIHPLAYLRAIEKKHKIKIRLQ